MDDVSAVEAVAVVVESMVVVESVVVVVLVPAGSVADVVPPVEGAGDDVLGVDVTAQAVSHQSIIVSTPRRSRYHGPGSSSVRGKAVGHPCPEPPEWYSETMWPLLPTAVAAPPPMASCAEIHKAVHNIRFDEQGHPCPDK